MLISVIEMILPIGIAFALGVMMRKRKLMNDEGCAQIKTLVSIVLIPVILFNAFLFADYSRESLAVIIVFFAAMLAVFGIGFLIRPLLPERGKYLPFVFGTVEGGTVGYPLLAMLYGTRGMSDMAILDAAHTAFLFLIAIPLLQAVDGSEPDLRKILKRAVLSPAFLSMVFGVVLGLLGVDSWLMASPVYSIYQSVVDFLSAPAAVLILITLGYNISVRSDLLRPVLFTAFTRLVTMGIFCVLSSLIIFRFMLYSREWQTALIIAFSLPASYSIPLFAKIRGHRDYVSTAISFETVVTLIVFAAVSVFARM